MPVDHRVSVGVGGDDHTIGPEHTFDPRPTLSELSAAVDALLWAAVPGDARVELEANLFKPTPTRLVAHFEE